MAFIISLLVGGVIYILILNFWPKGEVVDLRRRFGQKKESVRPLAKISNSVIEAVIKQVSKINWDWIVKQREAIKKQLDMAGNPVNMTPDGFIAFTMIFEYFCILP